MLKGPSQYIVYADAYLKILYNTVKCMPFTHDLLLLFTGEPFISQRFEKAFHPNHKKLYIFYMTPFGL